MLDTRKKYWDESYQRNENCVLFPKEEVVKFLSRFVRAKQPDGSFINKFPSMAQSMKALDFGCGMGRQTKLLNEFGLESIGVDLSDIAIKKAQQAHPELAANFMSLPAEESLPFEDHYFAIAIAESVLDSMSFELAKQSLSEIARVTKGLVFISLISATCNHTGNYLANDEIVESQHEQGTVQSYYNMPRIRQLLADTGFDILWYNLHQDYFNDEEIISFARYYLVLENK